MTRMHLHRVDKQLRTSEKWAFVLSLLRQRKAKLKSNRDEKLKDLGGKISVTWFFMSALSLLAALGFGLYASFNAQGAIAGMVDPMGDQAVSKVILSVIGASISITGILMGHGVFEGISIDPYTGNRQFGLRFWSFSGGSIIYVGFQFFLVKSAGAGSVGFQEFPFVVGGIALLELIIGAAFLNNAFNYIMLFILGSQLKAVTRKAYNAARIVNDSYRNYEGFLNAYNKENKANPVKKECNKNIQHAIEYFSGSSLDDDMSSYSNDVLQDLFS